MLFRSDTPSVHLYLGWARHRIVELSHPLNATSQLTTTPQVQVGTATVTQEDSNTMIVNCWIEISFESNGSGVNGIQFEATASFSKTDSGLLLTDFLPDYHPSTYQSLRNQFDQMDQPTIEQVDQIVDYAIDDFRRNNPG